MLTVTNDRHYQAALRSGAIIATLASAHCGGCGDSTLAQVPVGLAVSPAILRFEPTPLTLSRSRTFEITNTGGVPLRSLEVRAIANDFAIVPLDRTIIAAGETIMVNVEFTPRAAGEKVGAAFVSAEGVATASVALIGAGAELQDCDDDSPCTLDVPRLDGTCTHAPISGPCEDDNACTTDAVCVEGRCLGAAVECTPPASCFAGLCDTERGCVFVTDPAACDDQDPCTIDTCTGGGCAHETAADGTPCGPFTQCVEVHVCVLGGCIAAAVPEMTPCSDGDACTEGDLCASQQCTGARVTRTADLISFAPTFGAERSFGAFLADGRGVIVDPLEDDRGGLVTVIDRATGAVVRVAEEIQPDLRSLDRATIVATSTRPEIAVLDGMGTLTLFDVSVAGQLTRRGSAATMVVSGSGRAAIVTLGDTLYTCGQGASSVVIVDIADRDRPRLAGTITAIGACSGLALDAARAQLLVASMAFSGAPGGFSRHDLSNARAPRRLDQALPGVATRIATNGSIIAVGEAGPFGRTSTITLLDPEDLGVVRSFDSGAFFFSEEIGDLVFAGDRLFVQSKGQLSVWDLGDPRAPEKLSALDRSGVGNGTNSPPAGALATDGVTLFRAADGVYGSVPLFLDVRTGTPRRLDHPALGSIRRIARHDGALYGMDRSSVRLIGDGDPDRPALVSASNHHPTTSATLWSLGPAAAPPRFLCETQQPGVYTSAYAAIWRDGSNPAAPVTLAPQFVPFSGGIARVEDDGHRALAVSVTFAGDRARLLAYDLDGLRPPAVTGPLVESASLELSRGPLDEQYGAIAFDADRALAVVIDPVLDLFDHSEIIGSHLFVARLPALTLEASATMRGYVVSALVRGDRLILLVKASGSLCCGPYLGEVVRTYRVRGTTLVLEGEAPVTEGWRVLEADDRSAVISTRRGAAFLELEDSGPRVIGEVDLPEAPSAATKVGERIWFAGLHGIAAVRPPCP